MCILKNNQFENGIYGFESNVIANTEMLYFIVNPELLYSFCIYICIIYAYFIVLRCFSCSVADNSYLLI